MVLSEELPTAAVRAVGEARSPFPSAGEGRSVNWKDWNIPLQGEMPAGLRRAGSARSVLLGRLGSGVKSFV